MSVGVPWNSRGIGLDKTPGCFVCGCEWRDPEAKEIGNPYLHNIAAHLAKENEQIALACFERGARMSYYHGDQDAPQIKVGACSFHLPELERLSVQWFISPRHICRLATSGLRRLERALKEDAAAVRAGEET